jgi:hypothetical protein
MKKYFVSLFVLLLFLVQEPVKAAPGLADVANDAARKFLNYYYENASQRYWDTSLVADAIPEPSPSWTGRDLYLIRGMSNFEPAPSYVQALEEMGFHTKAFPDPNEPDLFQPWPIKAGNLILYFKDHPEEIREGTVYVGHSTGGLVVYVLAAMVKGGDLEVIRQTLPPLQGLPLSELQTIVDRLKASNPSFITIATPFHGIRLTLLGELLDDIFGNFKSLLFVKSLTEDYIHNLYYEVGLWPDEVIDGNLIGRAEGIFRQEEDFRSWAVRSFIQVSLRFFASFTEPDSDSDGIVPRSSALLYGPVQKELPLDHLAMVEMPKAVIALLEVFLDLTL